MKGHNKHKKLEKPDLGKFQRNEYAIIGAPCGEIRNLVNSILDLNQGKKKIVYIDETHDHGKKPQDLNQIVKMGEHFEYHKSGEWNSFNNRILFNEFDFAIVNGNHFKARNQIVILDSRKEESLSRKLDRLENVKAFIKNGEVSEPYDFLKSSIENWETIPIIESGDVQAIFNVLNSKSKVPLKALILAGGKSVRMGHDKGKIKYHQKEQREHLYHELETMVDEVFMSCREDQTAELAEFQLVTDKLIGFGPYGAIISAYMHDPNAAWIVIPCDLPYLGRKELELLISERDEDKFATAFLNNDTQFPEPLVSIWEPKMYQNLLSYLGMGFSCPRKVLINSDVHLIVVDNQNFLRNVNTPEELEKVRKEF